MASDTFFDSMGDIALAILFIGIFLGLIWAFMTIFESYVQIAIGLIVFGIVLGIITELLSTIKATAHNDKIQDIIPILEFVAVFMVFFGFVSIFLGIRSIFFML